MIAEPYICIKGPKLGEITWSVTNGEALVCGEWQSYADFEREKLIELCKLTRGNNFNLIYHGIEYEDGYSYMGYHSDTMIGFGVDDYCDSSESNRLLKRAEFLKAVCEKEGVEWLPKQIILKSRQAGDAYMNNLIAEELKKACSDKPEPEGDFATGGFIPKTDAPIPAMLSHGCHMTIKEWEGSGYPLPHEMHSKKPEPNYYTKADVDHMYMRIQVAFNTAMERLEKKFRDIEE